ncbi:probable F-box protein At5g47300 [Eutrema salsugineum]|uniref:probable F-box protein At5g47300 n=1 Tax=Eutrema salsugineum TaxID=72664 RepID=UPI000CED37BC|nr:probable F-box protein At5g47300 [Eutrema salsugineum]
MTTDLPEDLLENILCRVPATSLKRFRSACKRWNRLFNDKRFATKHFDKAAKQFMFLIMLKKKLRFRVVDTRSTLGQFEIFRVSHCYGLLLCTNKDNIRIVVWNPCTGQTKWIQTKTHHSGEEATFTLGSYQEDNKSGNISYKILRYDNGDNYNPEFEIYDLNSNSWRILYDSPGSHLTRDGVFLKGKTYWIALDDIGDRPEEALLVSFDYTTERFGTMRLPYLYGCESLSLSVVREEKLSVLLQRTNPLWTEIWVINTIGEWSKVLTVDYPQFTGDGLSTVSFLVDEEKEKIVCCEKRCLFVSIDIEHIDIVYTTEEDDKVTEVGFVEATHGPMIHNYVPSLVQIQ